MRVRVIDTSSAILIKQLPKVIRTRVLAELDQLAEAGSLVFPPEVLGELERYIDRENPSQPDVPLAWAKKNEVKATRYGRLYDEAQRVLKRVPDLIDPTKVAVGGVDDADPYVLALALRLQAQGEDVIVITDDTQTKPRKMALADAAGIFRLPSMTLRTFLIHEENFWDGVEGT